MKAARHILPVIVLAQFCGTSLWFAGNGIMDDLVVAFGLELTAMGHLTSAVQLGFITGTLLFAILTIADRYSPSAVFLTCGILGAVMNTGLIWDGNDITSLLALRFGTGFFLAGIYPVGMKIAADHFEEGLGRSLSWLVGALVVGTAFPHLLKGAFGDVPWKDLVLATSGIAVFGGALLYLLVPDGPYRKPGRHLKLSAFMDVFKVRKFRSAAIGYFGHMWELYAFWAFVPTILVTYSIHNNLIDLDIPWLSFGIIAVGGVGCVVGGRLSQRFGAPRVAFWALTLSGICCLLSPFAFQWSATAFLAFLFIWGLVVIPDSPLFSTLVAHNSDPTVKGTALTIVNCIGFALTIVSIQCLNYVQSIIPAEYIYLILAIGPALGLFVFYRSYRLTDG